MVDLRATFPDVLARKRFSDATFPFSRGLGFLGQRGFTIVLDVAVLRTLFYADRSRQFTRTLVPARSPNLPLFFCYLSVNFLLISVTSVDFCSFSVDCRLLIEALSQEMVCEWAVKYQKEVHTETSWDGPPNFFHAAK